MKVSLASGVGLLVVTVCAIFLSANGHLGIIGSHSRIVYAGFVYCAEFTARGRQPYAKLVPAVNATIELFEKDLMSDDILATNMTKGTGFFVIDGNEEELYGPSGCYLKIHHKCPPFGWRLPEKHEDMCCTYTSKFDLPTPLEHSEVIGQFLNLVMAQIDSYNCEQCEPGMKPNGKMVETIDEADPICA